MERFGIFYVMDTMKRIFFIFSFFLFATGVFFAPKNVFAQSSGSGTLVGGWTSGLNLVKTESELSDKTVKDIITTTMMWMLTIVGFLAIIGFVISGILYLTAAGNDNQIKQAKTAMWYSILGVIVALMGAVVVFAVDAWLFADAVPNI